MKFSHKFEKPTNRQESAISKREENEERRNTHIRKAVHLLKKTFLIGMSVLTIGGSTLYRFRNRYPSEKIVKVVNEKERVGFDETTEKILSILEDEFIEKMRDVSLKEVTKQDEEMLRNRFKDFVVQYLDGVDISLIESEEDYPFIMRVSREPDGFYTKDDIHLKPSKYLIQNVRGVEEAKNSKGKEEKDDERITTEDFDIFISEAAHRINRDLDLLRFVNIPADIVKNKLDQGETYNDYSAVEFQAHSLTERAIRVYLEQKLTEKEISFERIYQVFLDSYKEVIHILGKRDDLFKNSEQKNFAMQIALGEMEYQFSRSLAFNSKNKDANFEEELPAIRESLSIWLKDSFPSFLEQLHSFDTEHYISKDVYHAILWKYVSVFLDSKHIPIEKMTKEEAQLFIDDFFIHKFLFNRSSLVRYGDINYDYQSKVVEHLEHIASLRNDSFIREKIIAPYADLYLTDVPSFILKEYFSDRDLDRIIPPLFEAQITSYYKTYKRDLSRKDIREDFSFFLGKIKEAIEKSDRENKGQLYESLSKKIQKVEQEVVKILVDQQNVKTH